MTSNLKWVILPVWHRIFPKNKRSFKTRIVKTVSTYIKQFDGYDLSIWYNLLYDFREYTGETWIHMDIVGYWGDKISGIIEIENTGNSTRVIYFI